MNNARGRTGGRGGTYRGRGRSNSRRGGFSGAATRGGGRSTTSGRVVRNNTPILATTDKSDFVNEMRQTLEGLCKSIATLTGRLDIFENRGPDKTQTREVPKNVAGPPNTLSINKDFALLSKCLFRRVQVIHHEGNWNPLPKSIAQRLDRLASDIRPPMPTDKVRDDIKRATADYAEKLRTIVASHLKSTRGELDNRLASMEHTDIDRAKQIAGKYITTQLGKRLSDARRCQLLDDAVNVATMPPPPPPTSGTDGFVTATGRQTNRKRNASNSPATTPTENRFEVLTSDIDTDNDTVLDDDDDVETHRQPPVTPTTKRQRNDDAVDSRSTTPQPSTPAARRSLRPSVSTMRTQSGVHVYSGIKDDWTFTPRDDTKTIVIADSNMKRTPHVPIRWEIFSLPGATPAHAAKAVRRLKKTTDLRHVIIQVGINYRNRGRGEYIREDFESIVQVLQTLGVRYTYSGISTAASLPASDREQCRYVNDVAREVFGQANFIPPLPDDECVISETDPYGTHHTERTIERVVDRMVFHNNNGMVF